MTKNADLLARRTAAVPRGVATAFPVFADRAENAELWDVEGKRYVDFAGGIAVLNTGHRHPKVIAAVHAETSTGVRSDIAALGELKGDARYAWSVRRRWAGAERRPG